MTKCECKWTIPLQEHIVKDYVGIGNIHEFKGENHRNRATILYLMSMFALNGRKSTIGQALWYYSPFSVQAKGQFTGFVSFDTSFQEVLRKNNQHALSAC